MCGTTHINCTFDYKTWAYYYVWLSIYDWNKGKLCREYHMSETECRGLPCQMVAKKIEYNQFSCNTNVYSLWKDWQHSRNSSCRWMAQSKTTLKQKVVRHQIVPQLVGNEASRSFYSTDTVWNWSIRTRVHYNRCVRCLLETSTKQMTSSQ